YDLFSFDWDPFHIHLAPDEPLDVPIIKPQFALPSGDCTRGAPYELDSDTVALHLESVAPKVVFTLPERALPISGTLSGHYTSQTYLQINQSDTAPIVIDQPGHFTAFLPQRTVAHAGSVTLTLVTPATVPGGQNELSNPADIHILPVGMAQNSFVGVSAWQGD